MSKEVPFPPDLTYKEKLFPCGYSPRAIHLATDQNGEPTKLYIGCKDGSLWSVPWDRYHEAEKLDRLTSEKPGKKRPQGIRSLFELVPDVLLIGRGNGDLDILNTRSPSKRKRIGNEDRWIRKLKRRSAKVPDPIPPDQSHYGGSVRAIGLVDSGKLFISFRRLGTVIVDIPHRDDWEQTSGDLDEIKKAVRSAVFNTKARVLQEGSGGKRTNLSGIRVLIRLEKQTGEKNCPWLIATEEGNLFEWSGDCADTAKSLDDRWPTGERPVLLNDFGLVRSRSTEPVRGLFLATDRGVHFIDRKTKVIDQKPPKKSIVRKLYEVRRISLPGLGSVCMALSYFERFDLRGQISIPVGRGCRGPRAPLL